MVHNEKCLYFFLHIIMPHTAFMFLYAVFILIIYIMNHNESPCLHFIHFLKEILDTSPCNIRFICFWTRRINRFNRNISNKKLILYTWHLCWKQIYIVRFWNIKWNHECTWSVSKILFNTIILNLMSYV